MRHKCVIPNGCTKIADPLRRDPLGVKRLFSHHDDPSQQVFFLYSILLKKENKIFKPGAKNGILR